jgi:hypothetical protein
VRVLGEALSAQRDPADIVDVVGGIEKEVTSVPVAAPHHDITFRWAELG